MRIADSRVSGLLPLQHSGFKDEGPPWDLDKRASIYGIRIAGRLDKENDAGHWLYDPQSVGDIHGGQLFKQIRGSRPVPMWRFATGVVVTRSLPSPVSTPGNNGQPPPVATPSPTPVATPTPTDGMPVATPGGGDNTYGPNAGQVTGSPGEGDYSVGGDAPGGSQGSGVLNGTVPTIPTTGNTNGYGAQSTGPGWVYGPGFGTAPPPPPPGSTVATGSPSPSGQPAPTIPDSCRPLIGPLAVSPILDADYNPDTRFIPLNPSIMIRNQKPVMSKPALDTLGITLIANDENKQIDLFFPTDNRLIAVNAGGDVQCGSLVADLTPDSSIDPDRMSTLQAMFWVIKKPAGAVNSIAWNIGPSGCRDRMGGYVIDDAANGGVKITPSPTPTPTPGSGNPVPTGGTPVPTGARPPVITEQSALGKGAAPDTIFTNAPQRGGAGANKGAAKVVARVSRSKGGPFDVGSGKCRHFTGATDADGHYIGPLHIQHGFLMRKNDAECGPLNITNWKPGDVFNKKAKVFFGWNDGAQMWDWWTTTLHSMPPYPPPYPQPYPYPYPQPYPYYPPVPTPSPYPVPTPSPSPYSPVPTGTPVPTGGTPTPYTPSGGTDIPTDGTNTGYVPISSGGGDGFAPDGGGTKLDGDTFTPAADPATPPDTTQPWTDPPDEPMFPPGYFAPDANGGAPLSSTMSNDPSPATNTPYISASYASSFANSLAQPLNYSSGKTNPLSSTMAQPSTSNPNSNLSNNTAGAMAAAAATAGPMTGMMSSFAGQGGATGSGSYGSNTGATGDPWVFTNLPGKGPFANGTGPGGWCIMPPEVNLQYVERYGLIPPNMTLSTTYFMVGPGAYFAAGVPELGNGTMKDGYRWGFDRTTGDLVWQTHANSQAATEAMRFTLTSQNFRWMSGQSVYGEFDHSNTGNRVYTFPDKSGTVALTSDLGNAPSIATTQADQSVVGTTFTSSTWLTFTVAANTKYYFKFMLQYTVNTIASGAKIQLIGPAATTNVLYWAETTNTAATVVKASSGTAFSTDVGYAASTTGVTYKIEIEGTFENGANAGSVTLQFANATLLDTITVLRDSFVQSSTAG